MNEGIVILAERWHWQLPYILDMEYDDFEDMVEAAKILNKRDADAIKKARGR